MGYDWGHGNRVLRGLRQEAARARFRPGGRVHPEQAALLHELPAARRPGRARGAGPETEIDPVPPRRAPDAPPFPEDRDGRRRRGRAPPAGRRGCVRPVVGARLDRPPRRGPKSGRPSRGRSGRPPPATPSSRRKPLKRPIRRTTTAGSRPGRRPRRSAKRPPPPKRPGRTWTGPRPRGTPSGTGRKPRRRPWDRPPPGRGTSRASRGNSTPGNALPASTRRTASSGKPPDSTAKPS